MPGLLLFYLSGGEGRTVSVQKSSLEMTNDLMLNGVLKFRYFHQIVSVVIPDLINAYCIAFLHKAVYLSEHESRPVSQ